MSQMESLYEQVRTCQKCGLGQGRTLAVPGEGPVTAPIMFIGEGPGYHEDRQGRPFVGAAGKYLSELLATIDLSRSDVYITNVVKCRPPKNRDPLPEEIETCRPYLDRQIELIRPRVIVTLGRFSMARYFAGQTISRVHGQHRRIGDQIYFPMFHPAAGLHQPRYRSMIEADFQRLATLLKELDPTESQHDDPPQTAEQLSLF